MSTLTDDGEMVYRITNDGFAEDAVYHATCMTNYLLKRIKDESEDYLTSEHVNLFQSLILTIKDDLLIHKKIFTLTQLLEFFSLNFCPLIERKGTHLPVSVLLRHRILDYNRCILKHQQLLWMSLTAITSKPLSSLSKGDAAPCHQRDTEFTKLMKAAPYLTGDNF
jgi:hypothetical protein